MARSDQRQEWRSELFDADGGAECARSCFLGCDQFGRNEYSLRQVDGQEDVDLSNYEGCNSNCWGYFGLCLGTLYIGSGVYTAKQTKRIRESYGIRGTYRDDVFKGICCQPCSLTRNQLEIRQREFEKMELQAAINARPPLPLGETDYQPMYTMRANTAYQEEPQMAHPTLRRASPMSDDAMAANRGVHFREPLSEQQAIHQGRHKNAPRVITLYPTETDIAQHERAWIGFEGLPPVPLIGSPTSSNDSERALGRRAKMLTPISEKSSQKDSLEDPRAQQGKENIHDWLRNMVRRSEDKPTPEKAVLVPGPGSPATFVPAPRQQENGVGRVGSLQGRVVSAMSPDSLTARSDNTPVPALDAPDVVVTPAKETGPASRAGTKPSGDHKIQSDEIILIPDAQPSPQHEIPADRQVAIPEAAPARQHDLSADAQQPQPGNSDSSPKKNDTESSSRPLTPRSWRAAQHTLSKDVRVPTPNRGPLVHSILADDRVLSPELSPAHYGHDILQDYFTASSPGTSEHDLGADPIIVTPGGAAARQHTIGADQRVMEPANQAREHNIRADERVASPAGKPKDHTISADNKVSSRIYKVFEHLLEPDRKAGGRAASDASKTQSE
ncbi:hypothetical protein QBC46DRAFT_424524 [Diplogelasinospora grovesii]|uniref:Uncharacterized protein n=1 Tax=Diplogelasinospora grovesii TaxID=303347 RepID=A0AAN6SA93_9PEZI|nr:hypothetical protein QBC46DRAFT_424524 [Diplogelasinospora grovesii]